MYKTEWKLGGTIIPWTFKTWIVRFKDVDLPIGDLANDILRDSEFPDEDDFGVILEHIYDKTRDSEVIEAFALAWNFYQASK